MSRQNLISAAIEIAGLQGIATTCGVSYQAVRKWEKSGRLPRTEWTGETDYAIHIENVTGGRITRKALLEPEAA